MTDRLREEVLEECVVETTGWAVERVARVVDALQRGVAPERKFEVLVIWIDDATAFTAPGRTIYMSRRLLECMADDDAAAMVIAHEIAHHELGHFSGRIGRALFHAAREEDADRRGIELCIAAGYDVDRCVEALRHLSEVTLNYGDIDGALGPEVDDDLAGRARRWWSQHRRGYASVRERIAAVQEHARRFRAGTADARRDAAEVRRRRTRMVVAVASAVTTVLVLVLLPRAP